ncbi:MAG: hypothetical protein IPL95_10750 [Saprospiraceae bacterium]|nr:hypothetical protein [Saprospiraceae bacterium]
MFEECYRIELSISKNFPNIIYAVYDSTSTYTKLIKSSDGGKSWNIIKTKWADNQDISRGYSFANLDINVHPRDTNIIWVGSFDLERSLDGGKNFVRIGSTLPNFQESIIFNPIHSNIMYFGNDSGIFYTKNGEDLYVQITSKNNNYNTTELYSCAIHPDTLSNYMVAGTAYQGNFKLNNFGISSGVSFINDLGSYCFIDQKNPNYQLVSSTLGNFYLSKDHGKLIMVQLIFMVNI